MKHLNRRQLLIGSAGSLLGLGAGCGSGSALSRSLTGYLLVREFYDISQSRLVAMRPDGSDRKLLLEVLDPFLVSISPEGELLQLSSELYSLEKQKEWRLPKRPAYTGVSGGLPAISAQDQWSPDGQFLLRIVPTDGSYSTVAVTLVNRQGELLRSLFTHSYWSDFHLGWLGNTAITWADGTGTYRLSREGGISEQISDTLLHTPSPDGRFLLRTRKIGQIETGSQDALECLELATGKVETLLTMDFVLHLRWSVGGRFLFVSGKDGNYVALRWEAATKAVTRFALNGNSSGRSIVIWSPDTQNIAYSWYNGQVSFLEVRGSLGEFSLPAGGTPLAWL